MKETELQRAAGPRRKKLNNRDREQERERIPMGYGTEREE